MLAAEEVLLELVFLDEDSAALSNCGVHDNELFAISYYDLHIEPCRASVKVASIIIDVVDLDDLNEGVREEAFQIWNLAGEFDP